MQRLREEAEAPDSEEDEGPCPMESSDDGGEPDGINGRSGAKDGTDEKRTGLDETGRRRGRWTRRGHGIYQFTVQREHSQPEGEPKPEEAEPDEEAWRVVGWKSKSKTP